jgi:hypothetical protein
VSFKLNRRTFLLGAGGVAVSLPALDCMLDGNGGLLEAQNRSIPKRYALLFAGQAIGGDGYARDRSLIDGSSRNETGHFIVPPETGQSYSVTTPLEPLRDLRQHYSLVSNLKIPFSRTSSDASAVPSGGAYRDFHGGGCSPLLSGMRSTSATFTCNGITSDQVIADLNEGQTTHRHLVLRAQVPFYLSGYGHAGRQYISYRSAGYDGKVEAQTSPRNAYMALFSGFVPDDGDAAAAELDFQLRSRRSVLDLIRGKRERLLGRVGTADRQRLERHFDEIRALEERITAMPPVAAGECQVLPDPGADPAIGGDNSGATSADIRPGTGYSGEHERARIMCDLIHMAFVCDLTRAATLQITAFQSHMSCLPVSEILGYGFYADLHELGHNGDQDNRGQLPVSMMLQWHLSHYAYLMEKLASTPEGAGSVLDNTALVFTPEGGHGIQLNSASDNYQTHSVEDMVMLVAGSKSELKLGHHIDGAGAHPVQVLVTAMQAAGYTGDTLGEVSGSLARLAV